MVERSENGSTGIDALDDLLGGLVWGDNVVWVGDDLVLHEFIEHALLATGGPATLVVTNDPLPEDLPGVEILDARAGHALADPVALEQAIIDRGRIPGARMV